MPFGLTNEQTTFQRKLDTLLIGFNWRTCLVYLKDVIMFFKSFDAHLEDVDMVLSSFGMEASPLT